ncbi:hypothetical protein E2C01_001569 [Portunus trituberculatus]|uniref:Uncharacterized protein n=1 Tax=Portunus trituberculatus TaxID=210409 RepID=A0A5B7CHM2_PORTR|nr:hypothetical protein [Portunus trituberculatus]
MSSCPSNFFCQQHKVFSVYLFNAKDYLVHCYLLAVPFPSVILHMLGPLIPAASL